MAEPRAKSKGRRPKLAKLPANAKVEKRPLLRPAITSPYAGADQPKIIYISAKTPFLSTVKRVEKLLHLADKRSVQSATTVAKQGVKGKRKRGGDDEILAIAEELEKSKRRKVGDGGYDGAEARGKREEVIMKGTGKAIHKVLELALWFQQREEEYVVRLKTGSIGAIDDISVDEAGNEGAKTRVEGDCNDDAQAGAQNGDAMDVEGDKHQDVQASVPGDGMETEPKEDAQAAKRNPKSKRGKHALADDEVPETRIRYTSVLEVFVSLR